MKTIVWPLLMAMSITSAVASENYWFKSNEGLRDSVDIPIAKEVVPSRMKLENGKVATGYQTIRITNMAESDNGLIVEVGGVKSAPIKPNKYADFKIDTGKQGQIANKVALYPEQPNLVSKINYGFEIQDLKTIWNDSGWQELYNNPNGCDEIGGCQSKDVYPTYTRTKIFTDEASLFKCSLGGVPNSEGGCKIEAKKPARYGCYAGWGENGSQCTRNWYSQPKKELKCPSTHEHRLGHVTTSSSKCYSKMEYPQCPKGTKFLESDYCITSVKFQGMNLKDWECPEKSHPYKLTTQFGQSVCSSYTAFRAPAYCKPGEEFWNEYCFGGESTPPVDTMTCSGTSELITHLGQAMCESKQTRNKQYICEEGRLNGTNCVVSENRGSPVEYCSKNYVSPKKGRCIFNETSSHEERSVSQKAPINTTKMWVQ